MSGARLDYDGSGRLALHGPLDFDSVPGLFAALPEGLGQRPLTVDLGGVTRADTAGMGFLLELMRLAGKERVRFHDVPEQLKAIIRVNGLEGPFGL